MSCRCKGNYSTVYLLKTKNKVMNGISSLNFYESLNKFIVGFLIFVLFVGPDTDLFTKPLFIISAYIVGCIYQAIIQVFTKSYLSLQKTGIKKARIEVYESKKESCKKHILAFMKELIWPLCLIPRTCTCNKLKDKMKGDNSSEEKEPYLKAYYKIAKAGLLMNIPVLEALENFMRNLIPIVFVYLILLIFKKDGISIVREFIPLFKGWQCADCLYKILTFILCVVVFNLVRWLRYYYQQTIYRLVWEGNKYLDKINSETK